MGYTTQSSIFYKLTLGNSNIKVKDIKLLENPDNISILHLVEKSQLSSAQVESLISVVTPQTLATVLSQAEELKAEADHKKAMIAIGLTAEKAIQMAIREFIPTAEVRRPTEGRGSFDLRVLNERNRKHFDMEIKSYAYGRGGSFLFAPAQAQRAIKREVNFAICILERAPGDLPMHIEYIRDHLQTCRISSRAFQEGYDDYLQHREIEDRPVDLSKLAITLLGDPRIKVDGGHLKMRGRNFDTLIRDIQLHIE